MEGDEALHACLIVCGLNEKQQDAVLAEGFPDLSSFRSMNHSSLTEMVKHIGSLKKNSVHIGEYHLHNMEALAWWIHDQRHRNREIVAEEFDAVTLETCLDELELETKEETDDEVVLSKFKDSFTGYVQWEVELFNYLSGLKGKSGVPLVYVIHKE